MVAVCLADGDVTAGSAVGSPYGIALRVPFANVAILGPGGHLKACCGNFEKKFDGMSWDSPAGSSGLALDPLSSSSVSHSDSSLESRIEIVG